MVLEWASVALKDVTETLNTGLDAIRRAPIVSYPTKLKCLRIQDISKSKPFKDWGHTEVKDTDYEKYRLQKGEIIMARTCSTGINFLVKEDLKAVFNNGLARVRLKADAHPPFIYYLFKSRSFINYIDGISGGTSVQLNMKVGDLAKFEFLLPPLPEQCAIAHILGTLDDKIENNRRMNETLEGMARAVFKSWFVDFDPVRAKREGRQPVGMDAETAALFPDSFEDSAMGKIPKGWEVGTLSQIATNHKRSVKPNEISEGTPYIALEHMPKRSIALSDWDHADEVVSNKYAFRKGEILFGKLRPYFHKVGVAQIDGICSTDILVIAPTASCWLGLAMSVASSDDFIAYTDAVSTGTKMPRTNWSDMGRYETVIPPNEVAQVYSNILDSSIQRMGSNIHEGRTLAATRDALLPKLLSGEIRVKDAEKVVGTLA